MQFEGLHDRSGVQHVDDPKDQPCRYHDQAENGCKASEMGSTAQEAKSGEPWEEETEASKETVGASGKKAANE